MKMLGQDVHTQEEFDDFKLNQFDALARKVEKLEGQLVSKKWVVGLSLLAVIHIAIDVLLLLK